MISDPEFMMIIIVCALVCLALHSGFDLPWMWALMPMWALGSIFVGLILALVTSYFN